MRGLIVFLYHLISVSYKLDETVSETPLRKLTLPLSNLFQVIHDHAELSHGKSAEGNSTNLALTGP